MTHDPFTQLASWLEEAKQCPAIQEPTAMSLATATAQGVPSVRIVLLKDLDSRGLVFYTNAESHKGQELAKNPHAALCFYWDALTRQVRLEGKVECASAIEADAYFASRPRESQISAWASVQSHLLSSFAELEKRYQEVEKQYAGQAIPRPPYWKGYRFIPTQIEFWEKGPYRLHHRHCFQRDTVEHPWQTYELNP